MDVTAGLVLARKRCRALRRAPDHPRETHRPPRQGLRGAQRERRRADQCEAQFVRRHDASPGPGQSTCTARFAGVAPLQRIELYVQLFWDALLEVVDILP